MVTIAKATGEWHPGWVPPPPNKAMPHAKQNHWMRYWGGTAAAAAKWQPKPKSAAGAADAAAPKTAAGEAGRPKTGLFAKTSPTWTVGFGFIPRAAGMSVCVCESDNTAFWFSVCLALLLCVVAWLVIKLQSTRRAVTSECGLQTTTRSPSTCLVPSMVYTTSGHAHLTSNCYQMKGASVTAMFVCKTCQKRALKQVAEGVDPFV